MFLILRVRAGEAGWAGPGQQERRGRLRSWASARTGIVTLIYCFKYFFLFLLGSGGEVMTTVLDSRRACGG